MATTAQETAARSDPVSVDLRGGAAGRTDRPISRDAADDPTAHYVRRVVERAPPLTPDQRRTLAELLAPVDD